jgi:hypothetical protein
MESTISSSGESSGSESSRAIRIVTPFSTVWDFFFWNQRHPVLPGPYCPTMVRLVKGASGEAVQNMNIMLGYPETMGLDVLPLFP